jgi:predicted short-subunit dehydrogenase-like oxidoreductase (DUF2520 family)
VVGLHGKRPSGLATSNGVLPPEISAANVIIISVRDPQIDEALEEVAGAAAQGRITRGTVVLHTSAIADPAAIRRLTSTGYPGGTFHPLVPFTDPDLSADLLRHGWVGLDGDIAARNAARRLAGHIGARTLDIPPGQKPAYHAAAVISSNFPVVLASIASHLLHEIGVPDASAHQAVESLMSGAMMNMQRALPDDALTGPIVRGDAETVGRHMRALQAHPEALNLYRTLSIAALEIAVRRGIDPKKLAALNAVLR